MVIMLKSILKIIGLFNSDNTAENDASPINQNDVDNTNQDTSQISTSVISRKDMEQFHFQRYQICDIIHVNGVDMMLLNKNNQFEALSDIIALNNMVTQALKTANIKLCLKICTEDIIFDPVVREAGTKFEYIQYHTYFECKPYTPTKRTSKYPLILHYATDYFDSSQKSFGQIYYMKDENIGKAIMIFWKGKTMYKVQLSCVGCTLIVQKVERNHGETKELLYKRS